MTAPATLDVQGRPMTYEEAAEEEFNVLSRLGHSAALKTLADDLWRHRKSIEGLTRHHLGLGKHDTCDVLERRHWIRGGFNMCVLLNITSPGRQERKVVFRCAMPHKLAEARYPGTVDEKLGCKVGSYVFIQENCPNVRIPHLYGFGFSDSRQFTHVCHRPFLVRISHMFRRCIYRLFDRVLSQYTCNATHHSVPFAYLLLDRINPKSGQMLSNTWDKYRDDPARRQRLFRGMAKIMLSLARLPQMQIGSFQFNDDGTLTLRNRPLTCSMSLLENDGAPRTMQRSDTYKCTDAFVADMITFHDQRFLHQPNSVNSETDCRSQMAVMTLLRVFSHRFIKREHRYGPFLLQLTDLHASNLFVDDDWNVTCLIDLEWLCALPREMLDVPYWLTGCSIDQIQDDRYVEFDKIRREFMHVFEKEERTMAAEQGLTITVSSVMQEMWDSNGTWFWRCLSSVNAMYLLLEDHLCPGRLPVSVEEAVSQFWCEDPDAVVRAKLADKERYDELLRQEF
ncbi:uncharacterized protein B0T15DRAFT_285932 [Chaetomium strumarium]|uniref:Aminoglycoside phosphotransferase domain-containing protein n=1 Tax=Chaetomium strumarium TaxID=1170767 RepID=A0AAJ0LZX1_9PEZI|nr:hypothetical protein B0T15DRAFT_285932 [Chaetomium strumarium]